MIVDDGRRYLERTSEKYDLIVIDPAPPVEAVGSSLLYSRELLVLVKNHLTPNGVLAHWLPRAGGDRTTDASLLKALHEVFPNLHVYNSLNQLGYHFLASQKPLPEPNARDMLARMPVKAVKDLMEWNRIDPVLLLEKVLSLKVTPNQRLAEASEIPSLTDDRPINEYFLLRQMGFIHSMEKRGQPHGYYE